MQNSNSKAKIINLHYFLHFLHSSYQLRLDFIEFQISKDKKYRDTFLLWEDLVNILEMMIDNIFIDNNISSIREIFFSLKDLISTLV